MRSRTLVPTTLIVLAACGDPGGPDGPPPLLSALPRELSPAEQRIATGATAFGLDLMREVSAALPSDSNAVLSPVSASFALGMTLNGAGGDTYDSMRAVLRLDGMSEEEINAGYRDLIGLLRSLDGGTEMQVANSVWGHAALAILPGFLDASRGFFDAEVRSLDFRDPATLRVINGWVDEATRGRIPRILDDIRSDEVLFLINAVYFKGRWRESFDPSETRTDSFHAADGIERSARFMVQEATLRYAEAPALQAVDLLYGNGAFAMTVVLPAAGGSAGELLRSLDAAGWDALVAQFHEATVQLSLPRFRFEYTRRLREDLIRLGMGIAFDERRADLSRLADVGSERLYLSRVDQRTFVDVNEEGTEAAAATSVGGAVTSAPLVYQMNVDRPFIFAIRERFSGTLLFLGLMNAVGE